ncbi:heavy-metal-associated domain-containing protein [Phosphitispora sp. TUW77]|uniref:heavy-metal-associated domain-containing protein n=1 Tax=Phosphitispora sp. TUW77 TaxID=3152361 RepID=UPI003AB60B25
MATTVLNVGGMSCNHCKMAVEKALKTLDGVQNANVDLDTKKVSIEYNPAGIDEAGLKKVIADAGYDV